MMRETWMTPTMPRQKFTDASLKGVVSNGLGFLWMGELMACMTWRRG